MVDLDPGIAEAVKAVNECANMPPQTARNYLEMLGGAAIHYMRAKFGEEYTRGWLEHALSDLDHPPLVEMRKPQ